MASSPQTDQIRYLKNRQRAIARFLAGIPAGLGGSVADTMVHEFEANAAEIAKLKEQRAEARKVRVVAQE